MVKVEDLYPGAEVVLGALRDGEAGITRCSRYSHRTVTVKEIRTDPFGERVEVHFFDTDGFFMFPSMIDHIVQDVSKTDIPVIDGFCQAFA